MLGGLGMSGLGPPQLARITSRTDDTRPLASAAAKEHLCQDGIIVIVITIVIIFIFTIFIIVIFIISY